MLSREGGDVHTLLVGDPAVLAELLDRTQHDPSRVSIVASDGFIEHGISPREGLQAQPRCSVAVACELVATGRAQAVVSTGNTGALILAASQKLGRIEGIRRAALAAVYPTALPHGPHDDPFALMLDVGATLVADADTLIGFATMGSAYSSVISGIREPRVALLSNGTEPSKGTPAIVEAHRRLVASQLAFAGNIEGLDVPRGSVDVVVCDGFLGNVVLKMVEGVGEVAKDLAKDASSRRLKYKIGLTMLGSGLRRISRLTDWKSYGGAPVLGLQGVVIKAHGRSEGRALRNAVKVAAKCVRGDLIGRIRAGVELAGLEEPHG
jgi:glycerol-3-phosphate acyltransferase PlsX